MDNCKKCNAMKKERKCDNNTPRVLQIESKEAPVLFHRVDIPASMGDSTTNPPVHGQYKNILLVYEADKKVFLFNSDGIYTQIAWGEVGDFDILGNRPKYAGELMTHNTDIPDVDAAVAAEAALRAAADSSLATAITNETTARTQADTALGDRITTETTERQANVADLSDRIDAEEDAREQAVTAVSNDLEQEIADRAAGDTTLGTRIGTEESARAQADAALGTRIDNEATTRSTADTNLGTRIDNEKDARESADTALGTRIDTEESTRTQADAALTQAINEKADIDDLATVATTGDYTDLSNTPTNLSDFTNDTNFQNAQQVSTSISNAVTPISTAINKVVMTDFDINSTPSTSTVKLDGAKQNISTGAITSKSVTLPVASSTQAGVMSSSIYNSVQTNSGNINAILNGSVAVSNLPETPTQTQLTSAWRTATGLTTLINGAKILDNTNSKVWTYYTNTTTWYESPAGSTVSVSIATNDSLGIVQGDATTDGKVFVEANGTMSVNGWDDVVDDISDNTANIASLQTEMNGKENTITAGTTSQYYRGDKTWQTLDKSSVGLANVDNTSDATKKTNFTGSIASGNTGFTTGGAVYTALSGKEGTITAGTTSQYYRGDKTWQALNKSAVGLANVDNTSDATKKTNFTGSIADGNTGFVTGDAVYDALAGKNKTIYTSSNLSPTADTTGDWITLLGGNGIYVTWYGQAAKFSHQPATYGFLITYINGNDIHQDFYQQVEGAHYVRSGNTTGWAVLDGESAGEFRNLGTKVDKTLSSTSTNPVQNKAVTTKINEIDRFYRSLRGDGILISANSDLNTLEFLKINRYHCPANNTAQTLSNCPTRYAFKMEVFCVNEDVYDDETTVAYKERLRIITDIRGAVYFQHNSSNAQKVWTYGSWVKSAVETDIGNGTLTIQKNGTNVDTFTANATSNKTVNITVPTKTSELTNNSNFVSDASYVHTDNNYTSGEKSSVSKIGNIEDNTSIHTLANNNATGSRWYRLGKITFTPHLQGAFTALKIYIGDGNNGRINQNAYIELVGQLGYAGDSSGGIAGWNAVFYPLKSPITISQIDVKVIAESNSEYQVWFWTSRTYVRPNVFFEPTIHKNNSLVVDNSSSFEVNDTGGWQNNAPTGTECNLALEYGGQVNVLEGVQINGSDLTITNKKVNIPYANDSTAGVFKTTGNFSTSVNPGNGALSSTVKTYAQYTSGYNDMFVSKGTLENVITGKGLVSSQEATKLKVLTQAEYDAIATKDTNTLYFIKEY